MEQANIKISEHLAGKPEKQVREDAKTRRHREMQERRALEKRKKSVVGERQRALRRLPIQRMTISPWA